MRDDLRPQQDLRAGRGALEKTLLLMDDDAVLCQRLRHAFEPLGLITTVAGSAAEADEFVRASPPAFAVLALRLRDGSGLQVMKAIRERRTDSRIVILSAYASVAAAASAIRAGADEYLVTPTQYEDVVRAVLRALTPSPPTSRDTHISANHISWAYIQNVYEINNRNVSATARDLKMHRRVLQKILQKRAPR